jgi:hypothetical protein
LADQLVGKVTEITENGDLLTDLTADQFADAPAGDAVRVLCDGHETFGIFPPDHDQPPFTFVAVLDDVLRLCIVDDSAKIMLGIRPGERVAVQW